MPEYHIAVDVSTPSMVYIPGGLIPFEVTITQEEGYPFENVFLDYDFAAFGAQTVRTEYVEGSFALISPSGIATSLEEKWQILSFRFQPASGQTSFVGPIRFRFTVRALTEAAPDTLVNTFSAYCQIIVDGQRQAAFGVSFKALAKGPRALLYAVKAGSAEVVTPPSPFTYTLTLINNGDLKAGPVTVTDPLPPRFTLTGVRAKVGAGDPFSISYELATKSNTLTVPAPGSADRPLVVPENGGQSTLFIHGRFT